MKKTWFLCLLMSILTACSSTQTPVKDGAPKKDIDVSQIPNATPTIERQIKSANPDTYVVLGKTYHVLKTSNGYDKKGIASWYGTKFQHKATSSGEIYNMLAMTAASKELPIPTYARVTNLENGRQVIVKVNDRGPFHENRIIDLSYAAAKKLGIVKNGTGLVEVKAIDPLRWQDGDILNPKTQRFEPKPKLYLQVAAFKQQSNAKHLETHLEETLHYAVTIHAHSPYYLVLVGPIHSIEESDHLNDVLVSEGFHPIMDVI